MTILLTLYAFALATLNGVRIMDSTYWMDEMFSIDLINMTVPELLKATANDVHPPLYYLILKTVCHFFGQSGPVLHAVSLLPYLIVLVIALTVVRKWFSKSAALLFITFTSLLQNAIRYNVEIRMYSWVVLFVLGAFLSLYAILYYNRKRDYALFVLCSLAAAYSHYYALIAVAFFYAVLMLYALIARREIVRRVVITWAVTIAGYIGWLVVLIRTLVIASSEWWLTWMPTFKQSFAVIFSGKYSWVLFWIYVAVIASFAILWIAQIAKGKRDGSGLDLVNELVWYIAGAASVFGTVAVGVGISHLIRPLYFDRYIYTAAVCAWLMVSVGLSRIRVQNTAPLAILLTLFMCYCGYFNYTKVCEQDALENTRTQATVQCIEEITGDGETPVMTVKATDYYIKIYFPELKRKMVDPAGTIAIDEDEKGTGHCLVTAEPLNEEAVNKLMEEGIICTEVRADLFKDDPERGGFIGDLNVWIYVLK